jgi:hypothetical protein
LAFPRDIGKVFVAPANHLCSVIGRELSASRATGTADPYVPRRGDTTVRGSSLLQRTPLNVRSLVNDLESHQEVRRSLSPRSPRRGSSPGRAPGRAPGWAPGSEETVVLSFFFFAKWRERVGERRAGGEGEPATAAGRWVG